MQAAPQAAPAAAPCGKALPYQAPVFLLEAAPHEYEA